MLEKMINSFRITWKLLMQWLKHNIYIYASLYIIEPYSCECYYLRFYIGFIILSMMNFYQMRNESHSKKFLT